MVENGKEDCEVDNDSDRLRFPLKAPNAGSTLVVRSYCRESSDGRLVSSELSSQSRGEDKDQL